MNIAIAAAIALRALLQECYHCCCMKVIVAAAIALRVTLDEDYIYHMPVTTVITASIKVYPRNQLVGMQFCQVWLLRCPVIPT